jgi:biopolymer transport protein ExbD
MRRARRRRATELNIVSMIDVLTVLVFFLLVNSAGIAIVGINLPDATAQPPKEPPRGLSVVVHDNSMMVIDRNGPLKDFPNTAEGYDLADVARFLRQIKEEAPNETAITLLLDPGVNYETTIHLIDAVRVQPTPDGLGERDLFPDVSLGDAPPLNTQAPANAAAPASSGATAAAAPSASPAK